MGVLFWREGGSDHNMGKPGKVTAKDEGYRARSAYKIIEINLKFNIFKSARVVIDLCAAPGGWMQAAIKNMPSHPGKVVVGVDLNRIDPIPGCASLVADITSAQCRTSLMKGWSQGKNKFDGVK